MNTQLTKLRQATDRLPTTMKSLILVSLLGFTFLIWYYSFWKDLWLSLTTIEHKIETIKSSEISIPNLQLQLNSLQKELQIVKDTIDKNKKSSIGFTGSLLLPQQTNEALNELLVTNNKLTLLYLENLPPRELRLPQTGSTILENGIVIKFIGDFFSTMDYLQAIDKLKWKIFWDTLEYKVTEYPAAEITLYLHTMGVTGDWVHA